MVSAVARRRSLWRHLASFGLIGALCGGIGCGSDTSNASGSNSCDAGQACTCADGTSGTITCKSGKLGACSCDVCQSKPSCYERCTCAGGDAMSCATQCGGGGGGNGGTAGTTGGGSGVGGSSTGGSTTGGTGGSTTGGTGGSTTGGTGGSTGGTGGSTACIDCLQQHCATQLQTCQQTTACTDCINCVPTSGCGPQNYTCIIQQCPSCYQASFAAQAVGNCGVANNCPC